MADKPMTMHAEVQLLKLLGYHSEECLKVGGIWVMVTMDILRPRSISLLMVVVKVPNSSSNLSSRSLMVLARCLFVMRGFMLVALLMVCTLSRAVLLRVHRQGKLLFCWGVCL